MPPQTATGWGLFGGGKKFLFPFIFLFSLFYFFAFL
jgi:hypothetical protein